MDYESFKNRYGVHLNRRQEEAMKAVDGRVLLLAVPGSGKTTVLVGRLGYMIFCREIEPENILTVTYTVAAAKDMKERFASVFGGDAASRLDFRTINSLSNQIIRYYARLAGGEAFKLISEEKRRELISAVYRDKVGTMPAENDIKGLSTSITYAKNRMLDKEGIEDLTGEGFDFGAVYEEYCKRMRTLKLMDFDDQMVYALTILKKYPEILSYFRNKYHYICVDEAQDTSKIQHEIIELLARPRGNLFMVGDEDQSIYGFRAAYPEALHAFGDKGGKILLLEENYRSNSEIVAAADAFIRKNSMRHPKRMISVRGKGGSLREISLFERRGQYKYLLKVASDCSEKTAVLYRDNDCALPLIDLLEREKLPYRCRQPELGFFRHRAVRDASQLIEFSNDTTNADLFLEIYYKLSVAISREEAHAAAAKSRENGRPPLELLASDTARSPWKRRLCRELQDNFHRLTLDRADSAIRRIMQEMGYGKYIEDRSGDVAKMEILEILGQHEQSAQGLIRRLYELEQIITEKATSASDCPFVLSTIHSSKGLEYDRVFLMDVYDGMLPKLSPDELVRAGEEAQKAYEEERRLFYVGMTRAKVNLNIFTFRDRRYRSDFTCDMFPDQLGRGKPQAKALPQVSIAPKADKKTAAKQASEYIPGVRVVHRSFGEGIVSRMQARFVTITFKSGDTKTFDLLAMIEQGIISRG
ncbi:MAG: ATP-dependent helicase [Clostridia bacterium]|nr:ATP-dependent helicase [Clostridia bacterium]